MRVGTYSWIALPSLFMVVFTVMAADTATQPNVSVLLHDAQQVLTRYQELDTEATCYTVSESKGDYKICEMQRRPNNQESERTKAIILRASNARNPSANDLLAIYVGIKDISQRLFDLMLDTNKINRLDLGEKYGKVGGDASSLASKLYVELRERISALEKDCAR